MFAMGLCFLWVLCGLSKAILQCYISICDGIISYIYCTIMLKGDAYNAVACFQSLTTRRQWQFDQVHLLFFNAFNFFNAFQRFLMRSTSPFKSLSRLFKCLQ